MSEDKSKLPAVPTSGKAGKLGRAALQALGAVPIAGAAFSVAAGMWSEAEQDKMNDFLEHWLRMLNDELEEKQKTIVEIMARLDLHDDEISKRLTSVEYQSLVKKTFREWPVAESEAKREYIRNILTNAAASTVSSDDVVRMFIGWIGAYSEMHFQVIAAIYNSNGITRGEMWQKIGRKRVREDSADADLFKLLIRDLSTGGIIRQHRETDYAGNFIKKQSTRSRGPSIGVTSAFDTEEGYELTQLGMQFIHYAMSDLPIRITAQKDQ